MEVMKELSMQIEELRECAAVITAAADTLTQILSTSRSKSPAADNAPAVPQKTYTFEEVRHQISLAVDAGLRTEMLDLIHSFGAQKVSEIEPKHYAAIMEKVAAMNPAEVSADE